MGFVDGTGLWEPGGGPMVTTAAGPGITRASHPPGFGAVCRSSKVRRAVGREQANVGRHDVSSPGPGQGPCVEGL